MHQTFCGRVIYVPSSDDDERQTRRWPVMLIMVGAPGSGKPCCRQRLQSSCKRGAQDAGTESARM
eukprot:scaffold30258_cov40-Prasinocladus_malaysianus.AAC.1